MREIRLQVFDRLDQLDALRPAWDELLARYPHSTTFSTWEWLASWWQSFGKNRRLLFLAGFDSTSLIGLAPLSISTERMGMSSFRVLRMMGDGTYDSDNLDFPIVPGYESAFAESLLQYLAKQRRQWDICRLDTLPQESAIGTRLANLLTSGYWTAFEDSSANSAVQLPDSWGAFTQSLASEDRKNLERYSRRLRSRYSVDIFRCEKRSELSEHLESLFQLHQGRWQAVGQPGSFASPERREFYRVLGERLMQRGFLEFWVLQLEGKTAAVQFGFRYRDRVFQLQEGYDRQHASDRVGFVLRGAVLQHLISQQVRTYDFLGGSDSYKARWNAKSGSYRNFRFAPTLGLGACWLQLADTTTRSKNWLRESFPSGWAKFRRYKNLAQGRLNIDSRPADLRPDQR